MAVRLSTYLRNYMLGIGSLKRVLQGGEIRIFTGSQPSSADNAETGTLLVTLTSSSGARTAETRGTGTITLSGSGGQVDSVTVDSADTLNLIGAAIPYDTSLTITAALVAAAINKYGRAVDIEATSSGAVITLYAPRGSGTEWNGVDITTSVSGGTLGAVDVNFGSGVTGVAFVNGLLFDAPASGSMEKDSTQTWSGVAVASGVAGWFRFVGAPTDAGTADSSFVLPRIDGNVATSGANLNLTSTNITATATQTVSSWTWTMPASA